jgi:hypothetical protein
MQMLFFDLMKQRNYIRVMKSIMMLKINVCKEDIMNRANWILANHIIIVLNQQLKLRDEYQMMIVI